MDMTRDTVPWYKQGWPWFLMFFPATAVVAGLITFWIAYSSFDGMVVDDYYKEGRAIDKTMARSTKAAELGLAADVTVRAEEVALVLETAEGVALPPALLLTIAHPTQGGMDQQVSLISRNGVYTAQIKPLQMIGRWQLQIEDESRSWRLNGAVTLPTETQVRIVPYGS